MNPFLPQPEPGRWKALSLALFTHLILGIVLFFGVQWKRNAPTVVEAELWSARPLPAVTAPVVEPVPEPKPAPKPEPEPKPEPKIVPKSEPKIEPKPLVKPDIATKEDKKPPKKPTKPEEPKKTEIPPKRPDFTAALRQEDIKRRLDAENAQNAQRAAASQKERATELWSDRIQGIIRGKIIKPPGLQGNPVAIFVVTLLPSGDVINIKLKQPSGVPEWDRATERAIVNSSPLPRPEDPTVFQRELTLTFCPDESAGCR